MSDQADRKQERSGATQGAVRLLVALHLPWLLFNPVLVAADYGEEQSYVPLAAVLALLTTGIQLRHSLATARGVRPRYWPYSLAALVVAATLPIWWWEWSWASQQMLVAASAAMLLKGRTAAVAVAMPVVGLVVASLLGAGVDGLTVTMKVLNAWYWVSGTAAAGGSLYAAAKLVLVLERLARTRAELAEAAIRQEQVRVSRDLHDLLGQSLSALALKGELAGKLLSVDPAAARREIEDLTALSRTAMHDVRTVAHSRHTPSLADELDAAAGLLDAAGIAARIEVEQPPLDARGRETIAWTLREGATNLLRHSDARVHDHHQKARANRSDGDGQRRDPARPGRTQIRPGRACGTSTGASGFAPGRPDRSGPVHVGRRDPGQGGVMIRVLVAEDMHMIRGALVALLSLEPDIEVVAELDRGDAVLDAAAETKPDVAILDIDMPGLDGLAAAELLHEQVPATQVLILTGLSQPGNLLRALTVHVRGFIVKDAPAATLADGVRRVAQGQRVIDPDLIAAALETGASPLTARETDVLREAQHGGSTQQIADQLYLSAATVRNYLSNAISKVGARNRLDAIRICRDAGWL